MLGLLRMELTLIRIALPLAKPYTSGTQNGAIESKPSTGASKNETTAPKPDAGYVAKVSVPRFGIGR